MGLLSPLSFVSLFMLCGLLVWAWRRERQKRFLQIQQLEEFYWMARQIAHEAASPLNDLEALIRDPNLDQNLRSLAQLTRSRIKAMVHDLRSHTALDQPIRRQRMALPVIRELIEEVVKEKKRAFEFVHCEVDWPKGEYECEINAVGFKRSLAGLIQRRAEALPFQVGRLFVRGTIHHEQLRVLITDQSRGLTESFLSMQTVAQSQVPSTPLNDALSSSLGNATQGSLVLPLSVNSGLLKT